MGMFKLPDWAHADFNSARSAYSDRVEINTDNELVKKHRLVGCYVATPAGMFDLVTNKFATKEGGWAFRQGASLYDGNNDDEYFAAPISGLAGWTIGCSVQVLATNFDRRFMSLGSGSDNTMLGLGNDNGGAGLHFRGFYRDAAGRATSLEVGGSDVTSRSSNSVTLSPTEAVLYHELLAGDAAALSTDNEFYPDYISFGAVKRASVSNFSNCRVSLAWVFDGLFSAAEIRSLHRNPSQLIRPRLPVLFSLPVSGVAGIVGTLNRTLGAITATAVGTIDTTAIFNQILSDVTADGLAGVDIDAFLDHQLAPVAAGGLAAIELQGTANITLADVSLSASGTAVSGLSASLNVTLDELAASGLAAVDIAALLDIALDNLSSQSLGTVALQGAANITLADLAVDAQGAVVSGVSGSLDISLAPLISAALGTVSLAAVADIALDSASLEALGKVDVTAALDIALAPLALDGLGVLGSNISGTANMVLADVAASTQGLLAVAGQLDAALASLASSGAGTVSITGLGDITLSSATLNAIGSALLPIEGTVAITLGEVTLASLAFTGLVVLASPVTLDIETQSVSIDVQCWDVGINFYN